MVCLRGLSLSLACATAALATSASTPPGHDELGQCSNTEPSSLLQSRTVVVKSDSQSDDELSPPSTCSSLKNKGSHFTVEISVGTPAQKFDVVADTGSNAVIVSSCICQNGGHCSKKDKCFTGTDRSSSFALQYKKMKGRMMPPMVKMTFGSGTIQAAIATDVVSVGGNVAKMDNSLLLMVERELRISSAFEGILGLGLPGSVIGHKKNVAALEEEEEAGEEEGAASKRKTHHGHFRSKKGFLEKAKVPRFSVCANTRTNGVLRLNQKAVPNLLSNVGKAHWSVQLSGVSVGKASTPSPICGESSMRHDGQTTPCAAIPDSGTTNILAPAAHLVSLFADLCKRWPRCFNKAKLIQKDMKKAKSSKAKRIKKLFSRFKADVTKSPKILSMLFQKVLLTCDNFVNATHGLDQELPPIHFHVAGGNGKKQTLSLLGGDYVYEVMKEDIHYVRKNLYGIFPVKIPVHEGKKRLCTGAFSTMNYDTKLNGPVWLFGLPIFYKFQVGYELNTKPPAVSFSEEPCGSCSDEGLIQKDPIALGSIPVESTVRQPRLMRGPWRHPTIDVNEPL